MENVSLFKIVFNTHHILHPGTDYTSSKYRGQSKSQNSWPVLLQL